MNVIKESPWNYIRKKDIFFQSKIQAMVWAVLDFWCSKDPDGLTQIVNLIRGENNK